MVSKSMSQMKAINSPDCPATSRDFGRRQRMKSLKSLEDSSNYIHVHQFKTTKLYGAWFNDPTKAGKKVRIFFGSHLTAHLAARAQDRAALKYKPLALNPQSIKLNFKEEDYVADQKLRDTLSCEEFAELIRKESRSKYTRMKPTLLSSSKEGDGLSLSKYLKEVVRKRGQPDEDEDAGGPDSNDGESGLEEGMEAPVPTANQERHASKEEPKTQCKGKEEPKTQRKGKRKAVTHASRIRRPRVLGPASRKPLVPPQPPLIWSQTRRRTGPQDSHEEDSNKVDSKEEDEDSSQGDHPGSPKGVTDFARNKLQYKLHKIGRAGHSTIQPDGIQTEVGSPLGPMHPKQTHGD